MCGRYFAYDFTTMHSLFQLLNELDLPADYNITPGRDVACIVAATDGNRIAILRWGLVPFWAKDPTIGNRLINARSETVAEKPAFREAFRNRRCLVPMNGFFEWQQQAGGPRQPWAIASTQQPLFAVAGIHSTWSVREQATASRGPENPLQSMALLTREAAPDMAFIHPRMPLILQPSDYQTWLAGDRHQALELIASNQPPPLRFWSVSTRVNSPRNNELSLLEEVTP